MSEKGKKKKSSKEEYLRSCIDNLNLRLADGEILGSVLLVIGYIFLIISSLEDKKEVYERRMGLKVTVEPAKRATSAARIIFLGIVVLAGVAIVRGREKQKEISLGLSKDSIIPFNAIAIGYIISTFANMLRVRGEYNLVRIRGNQEVFV